MDAQLSSFQRGLMNVFPPALMHTYDGNSMTQIFHPLLALIASATDSELAKYVDYLKQENKILRARLPKQVHTTVEERKTLLKYGKAVGKAISELITIVSPATFCKWVREEKNGKPAPKNPKGGQRKPADVRELVLKIAEETGFGLTRIVGEMRKLGITIGRQTVRRILKEHGIEPSPDRTSDTWSDFLNRHGETLWGCDFFSVKSVTATGIRDLYKYDYQALAANIQFVNEDIDMGLIETPKTLDDWVNAIVDDFRANLAHATPESTAIAQALYRSQFGSKAERECFELHTK